MHKVSENPFKNRVSTQTVFLTCVALFSALYIVSNIMAVKVISLFGLFYFDAGTITFPLAYMLGDVITELWGYRTARRVIFITLFCNVLMVLNTQLGVILPSPDYMAETAEAYNHIFNYVPRIVFASLIGFAGTVSTHDLMMMIIFQYFSKLIIESLFGTPLAYAVIGWIKRYTDYNETILSHRG